MLRNIILLSILSLAALLAVACNKPTDDAITTEIKAKMFSESLLKSASVNVTSKDGIVTLTGIVPDDAARLAADRLASGTKGVKQIIDSTTVAAPAPPVAEAQPSPPPQPAPPPQKSSARRKPVPRNLERAPASAPSAPEATSAATTSPEPAAAPPPAAPATPPPPQPITVTIPDGTVVSVRTIDAIDSATSSTGQFFRGSLDAPVSVGDQVVLPKGLNVKLKLVEVASAGKFQGRSVLSVSLDTVAYQGKTYTLSSSDVQEKGASRGKRSAAVIGGGAVLGAIIGGLAGGGKGAAIGAAAGGGGGTAVQAMTKGQQVKIPSETRLDFTLHAPVAVTYIPGKPSSRAAPAPADQTPQPTDQQAPQQ